MKNNNKITEIPDEVLGQQELNPKTNTEESSKAITELPDGVDSPNYERLGPSQMPNLFDDRNTDATEFDFQLKIGGDNEEIRAQNQSVPGLFGKAAVQTAAMAVGGAIEGTGYMLDLVTDTPELISGDEIQFNNLLTKFGKGIQDYVSEDLAPIYQTKRAQEGGMQALGDATYLAGNMPTIASSVAIMVPTYAATRALSLVGRGLKSTRVGRKAGETVAETMSPAIRNAMNNRRAQGLVNHAGNTVLSRHTYNSLEANDTFQQTYQERIQAGDDEETAKKKAGQAAAYMYRAGYVNIWKDALQWKIILGTKFSSPRASQPFFTKAGATAGRSMADRRRLVELGKKFPGGRIPQRAIMQAGIAGKKGKEALKALGKMGVAEGLEEINIQHQKQLAMDYVDMITEADSSEPLTGWGDIYGDMIPTYASTLKDFAYDEDTIISPKAFDAAFWAFASGASMGGVMKAGQSLADRKFGSAASNMAKQKAELDYFRTQAESYKKAMKDNDKVLADQILDDAEFSMFIQGHNEGNTHVDGALSGARMEDLIKSLEGIVQADNDTLDNSGIPSDSESRQMYERMYADALMVEEMFEKNYSTKAGFGDAYDRKLATAQTYYEFQKRRWSERLSDFNSRKAEIDSKLDTGIFESNYKDIADIKAKQEGFKQAKVKFELQLEDVEAYEPTTKGEVESKKRNINKLQKQIENASDRIKELKQWEKDLREDTETSEQQEKIVDEYVENQVQLVQLESDIAQYESSIEEIETRQKELSTKEGQKAYVDRIKKSHKEALNNERVAKIDLAETLESLNEIDLDGTSAQTKRVFNDKKSLLKRRDQEVSKVKKPKIDQSYIEDVDNKIPYLESVDELNEFKDQIDQQEDLHGNTQKAIKKYAEEVFQASQLGQQVELSKQEARDLRKKLIKENKQKHVNKLEKFSDPGEGIKYIEESGLTTEEKRELKNFYKKTLITRRDKIAKKDMKVFEEAKEESDVRKGKKPAATPEDLEFDPGDVSDIDSTKDPRPEPPVQTEDTTESTETEESDTTEQETETEDTTEDQFDPSNLEMDPSDTSVVDDMFGKEDKPSEETESTKQDSIDTSSDVIGTETFSAPTPDGKLSKSEGKDLFKLHKTSETEGYLEIIESSDYVGLAANHPDGFLRPIFKELNDNDNDSSKIFNVTPAKFKKVGDKWEIVEKGEISYETRLESEDTQTETTQEEATESEAETQQQDTTEDREGIPIEYKGTKVVIDKGIPHGGRAVKGKGKKSNKILVNPEKLKEEFDNKKWSDPREIESKKKGQLIGSGTVKAIPKEFFQTFEQYKQFAIEHERQHLLTPHQKFFRENPDALRHDYKQYINEQALKELGYDTADAYEATWSDAVESTEAKVDKSKSQAAEKGNNRIFTLTKAEYKYDSNQPKSRNKLQFKLEDGKLHVSATSYTRSNPDIDFSEVANPEINEGSEIEVVLQENSYTKKFNDNASHPLAIVDKASGKKIGLLNSASYSANPELRKAITQALKDGKEVTATVTGKIDNKDNINNIIINDKPYFRSLNTLKKRWVEKEDGSWSKESAPIIVTTSTGSGDTRILSIDSEYFDFLPENVKRNINKSIADTPLESDTGFKFDGHAWAIVPKPDGTYRGIKITTNKLDSKAVDKAYDAIINNRKDEASEIVFTDSSPFTKPNKKLYLEVSSAPTKRKPNEESIDLNMIRYYDENADRIIQISKTERDDKFTIKQLKDDVALTNSLSAEDFEIRTKPLNYEDGLRKLLSNKRYNIDRQRAGQMDVKYTSPVNPDNEYANYYEYLTSKKELESVSDDFQGDDNAKSILMTDVYNNDGSFTSNVGVQIEINDIEATKQQEETQKEEVITQKDTQAEEATGEPKKKKKPRKRRKSKADIKLEEAYNETSELQEKYVSLEDFKDKYRYDEAPDIDLFIESEIERIKNDC